ncbi:hypothetical protein [Zobellia galactanivorans]|uniref:hypothetical protein n=1 Tax=Zobellia galactanivorans (strain DSM 12802 / CCUG 47099 / CIP 106680 / NCIMB 13871 / Dsij) TaxID=63186 RepID=UPI000217E979|nr:hypothetical protein [Zobellia galactanivorans]CAZ98564.1 Pseudogene of protein [Zobellia galactanivorans]
MIPFTKVFDNHRTGTKMKEYRAQKHVCIECYLRRTCLGKSAQEKKFSVTYYRAEYERNIKRVNSGRGQVYEGQAPGYGGPRFRNADAVYGA